MKDRKDKSRWKKGYIRQCSSRRVDQVLQIILLLASVCQPEPLSLLFVQVDGREKRRMTWQGGRTAHWIDKGASDIYRITFIIKAGGHRRLSLSWWWMAFCFPACFWLPVSFFTMWLVWFSTVCFFHLSAAPRSTSASMTSTSTRRNSTSRRTSSMWTKVVPSIRSSKWKPTTPIVRPSTATFAATTSSTKINHLPSTTKVCASSTRLDSLRSFYVGSTPSPVLLLYKRKSLV